MSVKRYSVGVDGVDQNGNLVKYTDYAALEQRLIESERYGRQTDITIDNLELKLAQMAAENAELKESRKNLAEFIHEELDAGYPLNMSIETPATDAFLAEVRSSAVDEVCLKISKAIINCYQDEQVGLDAAATICGDFASLIRKGVQS